MVPFEREMVISYRLFIVTITLSLTIRPHFAIECLRRSNQQGWVTLAQNLGRKGLTDVSPKSDLAKEMMSISSAV